MEEIKLTQFSHGAGCGCKIAPGVLEQILKSSTTVIHNKKLLVGNSSNDDAAVYDIGNGQALISTTDFFTPIVDDPYEFGRIAAANAISDVYAMGGRPLMAIAILGWPIEKIAVEIASSVIDGGRSVCEEAGIPLAGGHSIDSPEPIFGLAVNGLVAINNIKQNNTAQQGDLIFLTKPLGTGILSTAQKRSLLKEEHLPSLIENLSSLNSIGEELGKIHGVTAMTDVTGFGLLGHLVEVAVGSNLGAEIYYDKIHVLDGVKEYITQRIAPDATFRNWNNYSQMVKFDPSIKVMEAFTLLPDPQTNGGLLFTVNEKDVSKITVILEKHGLGRFIEPIGRMIPKSEKIVYIK